MNRMVYMELDDFSSCKNHHYNDDDNIVFPICP